MALQSQLLRGQSKLEAAATSDPAHVTPGAIGEHVNKIQQALIRVDGAAITADGKYGPKTAAAVAAFKTKRRIFNLQGKIDNIVGKKTIAALDDEMLAKERGGGGSRALLGFDVPGNLLGLGLPQDLFVLLDGTGNRNQEGARLATEEKFFKAKSQFNTTAYLAGHLPVEAIIHFGGRGNGKPGDPSATVAALVAAVRLQTPNGVTIIAGNSVGALSALKTAALVSALGIQLDYVSIADGAFFDRNGEMTSINPLQIVVPAGIEVTKADNFFQVFGHELLRGKGNVGPTGFSVGVEFHGPLNTAKFNNENLELTGASTRAKILEITKVLEKILRIDTISSRIDASNRLHEAAVEDGENKRDAVIAKLIKP